MACCLRCCVDRTSLRPLGSFMAICRWSRFDDVSIIRRQGVALAASIDSKYTCLALNELAICLPDPFGVLDREELPLRIVICLLSFSIAALESVSNMRPCHADWSSYLSKSGLCLQAPNLPPPAAQAFLSSSDTPLDNLYTGNNTRVSLEPFLAALSCFR